jgi:hypothetical protein
MLPNLQLIGNSINALESILDTSIDVRTTKLNKLIVAYNRLNQPIRNNPAITASLNEEVEDILSEMEGLDKQLFMWYEQFSTIEKCVPLAAKLLSCFSLWKQYLMWYSLTGKADVVFICREHLRGLAEELRIVFDLANNCRKLYPNEPGQNA